MATFNVGVREDDVQQAELLPEDWYCVQISKDPAKDKNRAWKDVGELLPLSEAQKIDSKAGENIVLRMVAVSDNPKWNGRMFTKWIGLPNEGDKDRYMNNGQCKFDWKAEQCFVWAKAFGGATEEGNISFAIGQKAMVYVVQGPDFSGEGMSNEITMNVAPRSIEGAATGSAAPVL